MAAGCQMSKCRARCRLIAGKLRDPGTKAPKGRYRFTPRVAIQDAEDRSIPFSIWTSREKARKGRKKVRRSLFRFIGSSLMIARNNQVILIMQKLEAINLLQMVSRDSLVISNSFITVL